jgi:hypothetical protein
MASSASDQWWGAIIPPRVFAGSRDRWHLATKLDLERGLDHDRDEILAAHQYLDECFRAEVARRLLLITRDLGVKASLKMRSLGGSRADVFVVVNNSELPLVGE